VALLERGGSGTAAAPPRVRRTLGGAESGTAATGETLAARPRLVLLVDGVCSTTQNTENKRFASIPTQPIYIEVQFLYELPVVARAIMSWVGLT
jgi:hypothetical protein